MVSNASRTPFVYWAQDEDKINLRVDIQNSQEPKIDLSKDGKCIQFRAIGHSAMGNGPVEYNFQIHLSKSVKEIISLSSHENRIEIQLKKGEKGFWKNGLLSQTEQKNLYKWLKFDFEKWRDDPDEQWEEEEIGESGQRQNPYLEKMLRELEEEKKLSLMSSEELAKRMDLMLATYLFVYNLGMFLIHFGALSLILFRFISTQKDEFLVNFWVDHSQMLIALTCLQYLDVFNSITGITKGSYKTAILQVSGRLFMLLIVNGCSSKCANWSAVPSLMVTYLLSEQFRYPHYALNSIGISLHSLVWLRYNAWLLLYPIGLTLEGLILLRSIPDYLHSGRYSLEMPNSLNLPFNFGIFLAIFTFICFPFIAFTLLKHMHRQRQKKMAEMGKGRNGMEEKKAA